MMDRFIERSSSVHHKKKRKDTVQVSKPISCTSKPQQMFLDLGQKQFGKNKECSDCGMFYVIGDVDDERRHGQNCAQVIPLS